MIKTRIFQFVDHIHNMQLCIEMISFINHENESILRWFYSFVNPGIFFVLLQAVFRRAGGLIYVFLLLSCGIRLLMFQPCFDRILICLIWSLIYYNIFQKYIFLSPKCLVMHCIFVWTIVQLLHNSLHTAQAWFHELYVRWVFYSRFTQTPFAVRMQSMCAM